MYKLGAIFSCLVLTFLPSVALAQIESSSEGSLVNAGAEAESSSSGNINLEQYRQSNTTENTSTVGGTVNNVGVNNSAGILVPGRSSQGQGSAECEVPIFEVSAAATNPGNGFSTSLGVIAGLRIPLDSEAQRNCNRRSSILVRQAELDTTLNLIRFCLELQDQGISINENAPLELVEACSMIEN
jgi:hypothetical protein